MKYTVITGASSGIGYATAMAFARANKNLILIARRIDNLEKLKKEINVLNPHLSILVKQCDLAKADNAHKLYEELKSLEIETFINNAGIGDFNTVSGQNLDKIQGMIHLNIESLTILSTLFVRDYKDVEGTTLINISSVGGHSIYINNVTYCATKFYLNAFTEGLAHELKAQGSKLRAKVLAPASTDSEFAKRSLGVEDLDYRAIAKRYNTPDEMAESICWFFTTAIR